MGPLELLNPQRAPGGLQLPGAHWSSSLEPVRTEAPTARRSPRLAPPFLFLSAFGVNPENCELRGFGCFLLSHLYLPREGVLKRKMRNC